MNLIFIAKEQFQGLKILKLIFRNNISNETSPRLYQNEKTRFQDIFSTNTNEEINRASVRTEYFQTPNQNEYKQPYTSKRKSKKLHYRTGSLQKKQINQFYKKEKIFDFNKKQIQEDNSQKIKFNFGKMYKTNKKINSEKSINMQNLIKGKIKKKLKKRFF